MLIKSPENSIEWDAYYDLRWRMLRAPWNQEKGTEKDELEHHKDTFHAMAVDDSNNICGVARLQVIDENMAQLRYMAVHPLHQGRGVGKALVLHLESKAQSIGIKNIKLQSRENAVNFYISLGYNLVEKTFLMYNSIQHYLMQKVLH
jgi:N-acetylglutamate synthase-like GNAT family acetyltransferase